MVSRDPAYRAEGAETVTSLERRTDAGEAQGRCMAGADEICIIGGGEIYRPGNGVADRLHVTHVLANLDGDTLFPAIDPEIWEMVCAEDFPAGEKDSHATRYTVYDGERQTRSRAEGELARHDQMLFVAANRAACGGPR